MRRNGGNLKKKKLKKKIQKIFKILSLLVEEKNDMKKNETYEKFYKFSFLQNTGNPNSNFE